MSNEEQAVLEFFGQEENLPLALSVSELVDGIRLRMNNAFWRTLHAWLEKLIEENGLPWAVLFTEDRNMEDCMVGVHLQPLPGQELFLRLMMEQQYMGDSPRIYYGVMWNTTPTPERAGLPEVVALRNTLQGEGLKNNENYLAWNWTDYHPRRRDFLQRYAGTTDALLDEVGGLLRHLLLDHGQALLAANTALREAPQTATVSIDQLRASIPKTSD